MPKSRTANSWTQPDKFHSLFGTNPGQVLPLVKIYPRTSQTIKFSLELNLAHNVHLTWVLFLERAYIYRYRGLVASLLYSVIL